MVQSRALTVAGYLASLPPDRRKVVAAVRRTIRAHLPRGYREAIRWGMISYEIPLSRYPHIYNRQPLSYAALAAQKSGYSLHLMGVYGSPKLLARLKAGFARAGKRLDMGRACIRFKQLEDLPLGVIGATIAALPVDDYLRYYESVKGRPR